MDSATDRERYFIRGSYFDLTQQLEKARHAYEALIRLDPDHGWGNNNLLKIYYEANQVRDAVRMTVKAADARPNDLRANRRAVLDLAGQLGELDQAQVYSKRAIGLLPSQISDWVELQVALFPAREHWMGGDAGKALEIVEQVSTKLPPASSRSGLIDFNLGTIHLDLGRLREAREFLARASRDNHVSVTVLTLISQKPNELRTHLNRLNNGRFMVHPVNGEVPPVKGRPRKLPHYANRGKTSSSGGELASARSCFSTVRTALGKLRITGLLAQFDVARSFPQFPRPLLLQPTILTSERGTRFGIRKAPNQVPPPHLPDDPVLSLHSRPF